MVYKIIGDKKKRIFLDSILITLIILLLGFSLGFFVENFRTAGVIQDYRDYEVEALDLKLQNYYYQIMDQSACDIAIDQNFVFADDLYDRGLQIEKFEEANQITNNVLREKRRYVLLKTELWLNTVLLKEKCGAPFDTVVYIYSNDPSSNVRVSEQKIISNILGEIKEERGNSIVLLPIAGDMDLGVVDLQLKTYGIESLPVIIINEDIVLQNYVPKEEIESHLSVL